MEKNAKFEEKVTDLNTTGVNPQIEARHRYNKFFTELNVTIRSMQNAIVLVPINDKLKKMKNDLNEFQTHYPDVFEKVKDTYCLEISAVLAYGMIEAKMSMELFDYYHDVCDEENAMELLDEVIAILQILNIDRATLLKATKMYLVVINYVVVKESKMIQNLETVIEICNFLEVK